MRRNRDEDQRLPSFCLTIAIRNAISLGGDADTLAEAQFHLHLYATFYYVAHLGNVTLRNWSYGSWQPQVIAGVIGKPSGVLSELPLRQSEFRVKSAACAFIRPSAANFL